MQPTAFGEDDLRTIGAVVANGITPGAPRMQIGDLMLAIHLPHLRDRYRDEPDAAVVVDLRTGDVAAGVSAPHALLRYATMDGRSDEYLLHPIHLFAGSTLEAAIASGHWQVEDAVDRYLAEF